MEKLSRRAALAGIAAGGAVLGISGGVRAAAPQTGDQGGSFYRHRVGDFEITQLGEGIQSIPLQSELVRNASVDEVRAALLQLPRQEMLFVYNPLVVNTGSKLILIDAGFGPDRPVGIENARPAGSTDRVRTRTGLLQKNMAAAGIDPKSIDIVLISHFHADHINGLRTEDGASAYPNAEIKVSATESKFWTDESNLSRGRSSGAFADTFKNVRRVLGAIEKQITLHEGNGELAPGILSLPTPGHTPGHTSYAISSGNGRLLVQSDVTIQTIFVRNPGWAAFTDVDPAQAVASRARFYDMAVAEKALIAGYHFPFPGLCHLDRSADRGGYHLVPIAWDPSL